MPHRTVMPSRMAHTWNLYRGDTVSMIGFYGLLFLLILTVFGHHIAPLRRIFSSSTKS
ncbi:hypothetical protein PCI56_08525 [Plesiomonas shigelloides subsp. oncorhynchi]|nr:hypothetical protein [Plesiomonas shigelloides]